MIHSISGRLIAKDLYLYRWFMVAAVLAGIVSVPVMHVSAGDGTSTGVNIGMILFMTAIIALGIFIVMYGILKERQDKSLLFVLSLPVSTNQYATTKIVSALIAFLVPWIILTAGMIGLIAVIGSSPDGSIPSFLAMMMFFLGNFCALLALILITMSERWAIAGILITNISVPAFLGTIFSLPAITEYRQTDVVVWSTPVLMIIGAAALVSVASLGLAFWFQSRKKDFI